MVELLRVLQEAAIEISRRGEEPLSPTTQETKMLMQFERYPTNAIEVDLVYIYGAEFNRPRHVAR